MSQNYQISWIVIHFHRGLIIRTVWWLLTLNFLIFPSDVLCWRAFSLRLLAVEFSTNQGMFSHILQIPNGKKTGLPPLWWVEIFNSQMTLREVLEQTTSDKVRTECESGVLPSLQFAVYLWTTVSGQKIWCEFWEMGIWGQYGSQ